MFRFLVLVSTSIAVVSANSYGSSYGGGGHSVPAAVISNHHVSHYDVPSSGHVQPTNIEVPPNVVPINFIFRSASSPIYVQQHHQGTHGSYKESHSRDEPHKLVHTVTKPIIQEVREIISPYRRITQTVEPVHEEIRTIVARNQYGGGGGGGMGSSIGAGNGGNFGSALNGGYGNSGNSGYGFGGSSMGGGSYGGHQQHY